MLKKRLNKLKRKLVTVLSVAVVLSSFPVTTSVANEPQTTNNGQELLFIIDYQDSLQSIGNYTYKLKEEPIDFNGFTLHDTATGEEKINISYCNNSIDELIRIAPSSYKYNYYNSYLQFNEINKGANTYIEFNTTEASDVTVVVSGNNKNVYLKNDENVQSETITNKSNKNSVVVFKTDAEKTYKLYADNGVRLFYLNVIPKFQNTSWFLGAEDFERLFEKTNEVNGTTGFINGLYIDCRNSNSINKLNNSIRFEANSVIYVPYIENKTLSIKTINNYENVKVNDNELSSNESFIINPNACKEKPGYVKIEVYKDDAYIKSIKWIESTEWSKGELFFSDLDTNKYDNKYNYLIEDSDDQYSNGFTIHDSYHPGDWEAYGFNNPNSQNKIHIITNASPKSTGVASASKATANSCVVFNEGKNDNNNYSCNPGDKTYIKFDTFEDSEVAVVAKGENGCKQVYLKTVDKDTNVSNVQKADIPTYYKSEKPSVILFKANANQTCYLYADGEGYKEQPGVCIYYVKVMSESKVESWDFTSDNFFGVLDKGENETTEIAGTTAYIDGLYIDAVENGASFKKYNDSSDRKEKGINLSKGTVIYVPIRDKKSIVVNAPNGYSNLTVNGKALTSAKSKFIVTDEGSGRKGYIKVEAKDGEADIKNIYFNNDISVPVAVSDLTYDGTKKVGVLPGVGYTLSGIYEAKDVGEYTATAKLEDGCKWEDGTTADKVINWSIGKATLTVTAKSKSITFGDNPSNDGVIYEGFVDDDTENNLSGTLNYDYSYSQYDNVGEYKITPGGLSSDKYNIEYVPGTLTVEKATISADLIVEPTQAKNTLTYSGQAQKLVTEGEVKTTFNNIIPGTMYYALTDSATESAPKFDGNSEVTDKKWSTSVPEATNAGKYKVWYMVVGNGNFKDTEAQSIDVTIDKATGKNNVQVSMEGWTYGEDAKTPTCTATYGSDTVTYTYSNKVAGEYSSDCPLTPGTWYVKATVEETASYPAGEGVQSFVIAKKPITITADSASKSYDGEALTKNSYNISENGLAYEDTISKVTVTGSQTVAGSSDNVASEAFIKNSDGKDVTDCYDISYEKGTLTVDKADSITDAPDKTISVEFTCDNVSKVTLPDNWSWSDADKDKALEVGTALTATAVYNGDDKANYTDEAKSVYVSITRSACTHNYDTVEYTWSDDNKTCTATKTCSVCKDKVTETVNSSSATISNCESEGKTTYTATFTKDGFEKQTKDVIIDATGHKYGEPTYTWSEDGKTCTATAVCANDAKHVLTEKVTVTSKVTTPSTCKDMGKTTYTAAFTNEVFTTQTKEVTDVAKQTTHTPKAAVKENEVTATCEADGSYEEVVYCSVCGEELSRETKTVKAAGHDYGEPTYTWSEDGKTCTATVICKREGCTDSSEGHKVTENAVVTSKVKEAATTEKMGTTTYTATFTNTLFAIQTKEVVDIPKLDTPSDTPSDNPSDKPADKPSDDPVDNPSDNPSDKPADKPSDDPVDNPSDNPSDKPADKPSDNPVDNPSDNPSDKPSDKPADKPSDDPVDNPSDKPADKPSDNPVDNPSDKPSDKPQDTTTPVETTTAPVVKEEGTTLSVAETKAEVVVSSKAGEEPTVEYKGTTDDTAKEVTVPDSVTVDGATYKVTEIAKEAFKGNKTIESIELSENIETIGENAFDGCTSLKTVDLPDSVKEIGDSAFNGCTSLKKVTIPNSVTEIGNKAFNGCKKLAAVNVGKNVVKVGDRAFAGCTSIKKVILSAKTIKIGKQAFKGTKKLKTLNIKSKKLTAKSISANAFKGIGNNVTIKVPKGMKKAYTALFRKKGLPKKVKIK